MMKAKTKIKTTNKPKNQPTKMKETKLVVILFAPFIRDYFSQQRKREGET